MDEPAPPPPPNTSGSAPPPPPLPPAEEIEDGEIATPPPPPPELEMEEGEINSPASCQLSPRGIKRADVDDDDGANSQSPPHKLRVMEEGIDFGQPSEHMDLQVIDDIEGSDEENKEEGESDTDDSEDWMDVEEVDAMLDEGVKDYKEKKAEMAKPVEREKVVLVGKHSLYLLRYFYVFVEVLFHIE